MKIAILSTDTPWGAQEMLRLGLERRRITALAGERRPPTAPRRRLRVHG